MRVWCWFRKVAVVVALGALVSSVVAGSGCGGARTPPATTGLEAAMTITVPDLPVTEPAVDRSTGSTIAPTEPAPSTPSTQAAGGGFGPGAYAKAPRDAGDLVIEVAGLVAADGVPVFLPDPLPSDYSVAAEVPWAPDGTIPWRWPMAGPRPAGYAVAYTDGSHLVRLDINPAGDLGDVTWRDADVWGTYGRLATTSAAGVTVVRVPNPDGVQILVWGATTEDAELLALAAAVRRMPR